MPIRHGALQRTTPGRRLALVAVGALAIVAMAGVGSVRDEPEPLATLAPVAATPPSPASGGPARVLVLADEASASTAQDLEASGTAGEDLEVVGSLPFTCEPSSAEARAGGVPVCGNWAAWSEVVGRDDPDVVLVLAEAWTGDEVGVMAGVDPSDGAAVGAWSDAVVAEGVEMLTAGGAVVLWAPPLAPDVEAALRRSNRPFARSIAASASEGASVQVVQVPAVVRAAPDEVRAWAEHLEAEVLRFRGWASDLLRVMVVGDSSARSLAWGLERWADAEGVAVVWTTAVEGCGLAQGGQYRTTRGRLVPLADKCEQVDDDWPEQVRAFRPDAVLVLTSNFDLAPRRLDGGDDVLRPGDGAFDEFLVEQFVEAVDLLGAEGAQVRWVQAPCTGLERVGGFAGDGSTLEAVDVEAIRHLNEVLLPRVVEQRPDRVTLVDLFSVLCPDGEFVRDIGIPNLRPDGIHFSTDGAWWVAQEHGRRLLGLD